MRTLSFWGVWTMRIRDCFSYTDNSEYVNLVHRNEKTAKEMEYHEKCLLELEELLQKGGIIALRRTKNRIAPFEVIGFYGDSLDEIYFKLLGRGLGRFSKLGIMYLYARNGESATLKGWHVEMPGHGDGTFFLESVMKYLRRQGYKKIVGEISFVDFDHELLLRHLYTKFGFEIVDHEYYRSIQCDLEEEFSEGEAAANITEWRQILDELGDDGRIRKKLGI